MRRRAERYGVQGVIETARKRLIERDKAQLITPESIEIPSAKLTEYALNPAGDKNKAKVFESALGYTLDNYQDLIDNIKEGIKKYPMEAHGKNPYGDLFHCDIEVTGPNGKTAVVRTGWIQVFGSSAFRLTTIYVK